MLKKYYINTNEILNHFTRGAFSYVTIATVIFSRVKIYHVFARKLTWYFVGVYIIKSRMALLGARTAPCDAILKDFVALKKAGKANANN